MSILQKTTILLFLFINILNAKTISQKEYSKHYCDYEIYDVLQRKPQTMTLKEKACFGIIIINSLNKKLPATRNNIITKQLSLIDKIYISYDLTNYSKKLDYNNFINKSKFFRICGFDFDFLFYKKQKLIFHKVVKARCKLSDNKYLSFLKE